MVCPLANSGSAAVGVSGRSPPPPWSWKLFEGQKLFKDLNDSSLPCHRQTASHSHDQPLVLVIDLKKHVLCFLLKFENMFFMCLYFLNVFLCFLMSCFFVVFETYTYKITNMMHFSWAKTPFPGQSECFVAVLLTLFDSYWRCFLLEWIL